MANDTDHPGVARHGRVVTDLAALSGAPAAWVGRDLPAVAAQHADMLAKSLQLDFVFVRFRDPNVTVAADFDRGNACVVLAKWLQDRLVEGERLSRLQVAPSSGDDAQGAAGSIRWEVLPESRLWGLDACSADGQSTQPNCLLSETLTARERDILVMIGQGSSNKRIARDLRISPETVKSHLKRIFMKLGVSTRTQAVCRAGSMGLL